MLFLYTLGATALSLLSIWLTSKRLFTVALFYWAGWLLGIGSAELGASLQLLPVISPRGVAWIQQLHLGAAGGFLLGTLIAGRIIPSLPANRRPPRLNGLLWGVILLEALLGFSLLGSRIAEAGFNLYAIRSAFLEQNYLVDVLPLPQRLYNVISLAALVPVVLWAAQDRAKGRVTAWRLLLAFAATVPGGLSTGGRVWVIQTLAAYLITYLIAPGPRINFLGHLRRAFQLTTAVAILAGVFTVMGQVRDVSRGEGVLHVEGEVSPVVARFLETFAPLYGYLGVPVAASDLYGETSAVRWDGRLNGEATFPWLVNQAQRLGVGQPSQILRYTEDVRQNVSRKDIRLSATHATLVPLLIADWGVRHLVLCAAVIFGLLQLTFLVFVRLGGPWLVPATMAALYGGLLIFQDASFGTASAVLPVVALAVLYPLARLTFRWEDRILTRARTG